jgi:ribokinase
LATALAEGKSLPDAVRFAHAAAALSVTKAGAINSIPTRAQVERFLVSSYLG